MKLSQPVSLIVDPPASGAWNMALDEALLEHASEKEIPTLRIYQWERPTLSLGYFQRYEERNTHPASAGVDVVRRQSGGGAILHDQEITYSLTVPNSHPLASDPQSLYLSIHRGLIDWLHGLLSDDSEFSLETFESTDQSIDINDEAFLCFLRRSSGDVVVRKASSSSEHKIIGSAQRRRRGAILQHGSILWSTSDFAQEICGFANIMENGKTLSAAQDNLVECLATLFGFDLERGLLLPAVEMKANEHLNDRYRQSSWTRRR